MSKATSNNVFCKTASVKLTESTVFIELAELYRHLERLRIHMEVELETPLDPKNTELDNKYDQGYNDAYEDILRKLTFV